MKVQFSKAVVASLPVGSHGDTKVTGLVCNVTPHSRKYGLYISVRGTPVRKSLGDVADISVEAVRLEAQRVIATLREAPKVKAQRTTLGEVVRLYSTHLEIQGVKYPEYMEGIMTLHWSDFLSRQLDSITALELSQAHNRIAKASGVSAARYAINCLRTVFNHAIGLELIATNPAKRVKTAPARSRDVYLDEYEIGLMRECLKEMAPNPRHFFLLAILTGMRRSNISGMKWSWVGSDTVIVPASESKNGEEMVVNLVPEAVEILKGRRALDPVYVFPSTSKINQPVSNVYEWLLDLRRRMRERGCDKNFTIHDLRRSYAVRLVSVGASLPIIAKALGHRSVSSTPIYARASADTVRDYLARV